MKVLITGSSGFIGNNLTNYLKKCGYTVHGLSRSKTSDKNTFNIDLSNRHKLNSLLRKNQYDVVVHLAAEIYNSDPLALFEANCTNTLNLLSACKTNSINKVVFASTHLVYGNSQYLPIDEEHPLNSVSNYAVSKLIAENICKMFFLSHGIEIIILRISSVVGFGQQEIFVIPTILNQIINKREIILHKYENGFQLMDLIRIDDVCKVFHHACKSKIKYDVYNVASGKPVTIEDLLSSLSKITTIGTIKTKHIKKKTNHFVYDIKKLTNDLNFKPNTVDENFLNSWIKQLQYNKA